MKIAVGADHAGVELKDHVVTLLEKSGHQVEDLGTHGTASVDYPDFGHAVARRVESGAVDRGVLICGTGVGVAMTANRHEGVRAVNSTDVVSVRLARSHNDANVLCLGARIVGTSLAEGLLEAFLNEEFEGGRHARRVSKIDALKGA